MSRYTRLLMLLALTVTLPFLRRVEIAPLDEVAATAPVVPAPAPVSGSLPLQSAPTMSAGEIDKVLASYGSPAAGKGKAFYDLGLQYDINPAIALAFFIQESSAGTAGMAVTTHSVGNIICAGYATCVGGFRSYASWEEAIDDWYKLITTEYIQGRGHQTVADVLPIYCPVADGCSTEHYISAVEQRVRDWAPVPSEQPAPSGSPLGSAPLSITQGYGVGTHAPAEVWGGIDLAASEGTPIYATHAGIASVQPNTWPGGNYLSVDSGEYRTAYAHLSAYAVGDGEQVERGQLIGYVGATGMATGPHLHYEVWWGGVNVDPMGYL